MLWRTLFSALFVFIISLAPALTASGQPAVPGVFTATDLASAIEAAADKSSIVAADFTSKTSVPSHNMDKSSWKHTDTVAWIDEHAVAVRIYIDEDEDAAETYGITDAPTRVIFRNGEAFDRASGYMGGKDLYAWLKKVEAGERRLDQARALHGDRIDENGDVDVWARYRLAETYLINKDYDKATDEYVWLWKHMLEFKFSRAVRGSSMVSSIKDLVAEYPPAEERFKAIRDETEQRLKVNPDWHDLNDWIVMNEALGDDENTLTWFDRIKQDSKRLPAMGQFTTRLVDLLRERGRWSDLGLIYQYPLMNVRSETKMLKMLQERGSDHLEMMTDHCLNDSAEIYVVCLAVRRDEEAAQIAEHLFTIYGSDDARIAMIRKSLDAGFAKNQHLAWLNVVETEPAGLREKVVSALSASSD